MSQTRRFWKALAGATLVPALATAGCSGKTADLGSNDATPSGPVFASTPAAPSSGAADSGPQVPWKLIDQDFAILNFVVDAGEIFWLVTSYSASPPSAPPAFLRKCKVADCAHSVMSWPVNALNGGGYSGVMHATTDSVYWINGFSLWTCPKTDCSNPRVVVDNQQVEDFAISEQTLFVLTTESTLLTCVASNCSDTLTRLAPSAPAGELDFAPAQRLVQDADYLYFELTDDRIGRLRKDDTGGFEVVAHNTGTISDLVQQADYVFWSEPVLLGNVFRCPKTGCVGQPEVYASALNRPTELAADDANLYFAESAPPTDASEAAGTISRCPLTGCDAPRLLEQVPWPGALVVDERFLYFSGFHCQGRSDLNALFSGPCGYIASVPK